MGKQLFTNNAIGTLAADILSTDTSIALNAGDGGMFPALSGTDWFLATMYEINGTSEINHEVVKVTARVTDTLTVVRAQEGTAARGFVAGTHFELRATAGMFAGLAKLDGSTGPLTVGGALNASGVAKLPILYQYHATPVFGATTTLDASLASSFSFTASGSGAAALAISNPPAAGYNCAVTVEIVNGGLRTWTWPTGTVWMSGSAPALKASGTDVLQFFTRNGGATWLGFTLTEGLLELAGGTMTGDLSMGNANLKSAKTVSFYGVSALGVISVNTTVDFSTAQYVSATMGASLTFTFGSPPGPCVVQLELTQDGTGSRVATWPASVKWPASYAAGDKALSTAAGARDLLVLRWNGADFVANLIKGIA